MCENVLQKSYRQLVFFIDSNLPLIILGHFQLVFVIFDAFFSIRIGIPKAEKGHIYSLSQKHGSKNKQGARQR